MPRNAYTRVVVTYVAYNMYSTNPLDSIATVRGASEFAAPGSQSAAHYLHLPRSNPHLFPSKKGRAGGHTLTHSTNARCFLLAHAQTSTAVSRTRRTPRSRERTSGSCVCVCGCVYVCVCVSRRTHQRNVRGATRAPLVPPSPLPCRHAIPEISDIPIAAVNRLLYH